MGIAILVVVVMLIFIFLTELMGDGSTHPPVEPPPSKCPKCKSSNYSLATHTPNRQYTKLVKEYIAYHEHSDGSLSSTYKWVEVENGPSEQNEYNIYHLTCNECGHGFKTTDYSRYNRSYEDD